MMRRKAICLVCVAGWYSPGGAQTTTEEKPEMRYSLGVSGGICFVNPKMLNESFDFMGNALNVDVPHVNTIGNVGLSLRMELPRFYIHIRGNFMQFERKVHYSVPTTTSSSTPSGTLAGENNRTYTVAPLGAGIGWHTRENQPPTDFEVSILFGLNEIKEFVSMEGYGSNTYTYSGSGIGGSIMIRPNFTVSENVLLSPELSYSYLPINSFTGSRGRALQGFVLDLSGLSISAALIFKF